MFAIVGTFGDRIGRWRLYALLFLALAGSGATTAGPLLSQATTASSTVIHQAARVKDVAEQLDISRNKVYELIYTGQIESLAIGRVRRVSPTALASSSLGRRTLAVSLTNPVLARAQSVRLADRHPHAPSFQRNGLIRSHARSISHRRRSLQRLAGAYR